MEFLRQRSNEWFLLLNLFIKNRLDLSIESGNEKKLVQETISE